MRLSRADCDASTRFGYIGASTTRDGAQEVLDQHMVKKVGLSSVFFFSNLFVRSDFVRYIYIYIRAKYL